MNTSSTRRHALAAMLAAVPLLAGRSPSAAATLDPENTLYIDLKDGRVVVQLLPNLAPKQVARIKLLARQHFYDGTPFHRVIEGFMAQGGDPTGTGTGGSQLPDLPAEFTHNRKFLRGTLGAARASDPDSANSQFFIMLKPNAGLDGQYTIFGQVVSGMQFVDNIRRGSSADNGKVDNPDKIVRMQVAADAKS